MEEIHYSAELLPHHETDTPTRLVLTQERNGVAIFIEHAGETRLLRFFLQHRRNEAIRWAVAQSNRSFADLLSESTPV